MLYDELLINIHIFLIKERSLLSHVDTARSNFSNVLAASLSSSKIDADGGTKQFDERDDATTASPRFSPDRARFMPRVRVCMYVCARNRGSPRAIRGKWPPWCSFRARCCARYDRVGLRVRVGACRGIRAAVVVVAVVFSNSSSLVIARQRRRRGRDNK